MNSNDLGDLMACLVRVSWAAAAGQLQMACAQSVTEYVAVTASRANSTSSTASTSSEGDSQWLHLGICVRQKSISLKDVTIAVEALQLLVTCLRLRPSLLRK
jgi:ubiquitin carboxyl-terminal hydrolase 9/24